MPELELVPKEGVAFVLNEKCGLGLSFVDETLEVAIVEVSLASSSSEEILREAFAQPIRIWKRSVGIVHIDKSCRISILSSLANQFWLESMASATLMDKQSMANSSSFTLDSDEENRGRQAEKMHSKAISGDGGTLENRALTASSTSSGKRSSLAASAKARIDSGGIDVTVFV